MRCDLLNFVLNNLYIFQILGAIAYLIGTFLLATSIEPFNPELAKDNYMPVKMNRKKFWCGIGCNLLGFLFVVGSLVIGRFLN